MMLKLMLSKYKTAKSPFVMPLTPLIANTTMTCDIKKMKPLPQDVISTEQCAVPIIQFS